MLRLEIAGQPIGGEDSRENAWVERVAQATSLHEVALEFVVQHNRKVDLDNLVRPAMRGLRNGGFYSKGFPELESLTAIQSFGPNAGLGVESYCPAQPSSPLLQISFDSVPPSTNSREWLRGWSSVIESSWIRSPLEASVWIAITARSSRSLVDLLKPIIDGCEAILGRDPSGRSEFCPNDHLVEWLQIRRVETGPILEFSIGLLEETVP